MTNLTLSLRFALRELRGGLRGFRIFIACIALGVATIAGVDSVAEMASETVAREGQAILGGDLSFMLTQREATADEQAFLESAGKISAIVKLRAMARRVDGEDQTLVELKAVDTPYPLYGEATLANGASLADALAGNGELTATAEESFFTRLNLKPGDMITIGAARLRLVAIATGEPDRLSGGADWGPHVMIAKSALAATGLIQPGSLVRYLYRVRLPEGATDADVHAIADAAKTRFPDAGWLIERRDAAAPGLQRSIDRLAEFLTLVGLAALIVGGVGVANAVRAFLDGKRDVIATFKCLGAPADFTVRIYFIEILILALVGIAIGLVVGAAIPFVAIHFLSGLLPLDSAPRIYPLQLLIATAYGIATAIAFAIVPLGRARDIPPTALFRGGATTDQRRLRLPYLLVAFAAAIILAGLAIGLAHERQTAIIFVVGALLAFILLRLIAVGIMALARAAPRARATELRLAVANIHRPGALTPSIVLSLGLGLTLLTTLGLIDGNLRRELTSTIPAKAPTFYFLDVPNSDFANFATRVAALAPAAVLDHVPMLRGRITTLNDTRAEDAKPDPEFRWVLSGDRGVTFAATLPARSTLTKGAWWPADYDGPPLVSIPDDVATGLHLKLGDKLTVNVLGRPVTAEIANFRVVKWENLAINFVLVFTPNTFRGAPYSDLATLAMPRNAPAADENRLLRAIGSEFPAVSTIRVKEALDRVNDLLGRITTAILAASSITLITAMLVLAGALAASHHRRLYEAVILKTLGATRRRVLTAFALEYLILALVTAIFGLFAGGIAAWYVLTHVMDAEFAPLPGVALGVTGLAILLTLGFGLAGTWRVLGAKPAPVLRNL